MPNKVPDFEKIGRELIKDAQTIAEVEMVNFVMSNFEKQGFRDSGFTPWKKRKGDADPGRAILTDSSSLRDSVKITGSSPERVTLSATARHAEIHNEGGQVNIPVTPKMKKYFWYMYKRTRNEKWKGMALTKKTHFSFTMPKRQFMGHSVSFNQHIEDLLIRSITNRFKQHLNTD